MTDHRLLHDSALIKINALDAQHVTVQSSSYVAHTIVNCFQRCGFNSNKVRYDTAEQQVYTFKNMYPLMMMMMMMMTMMMMCV
jgi:hypothetical protein